MSTGAVLTRCMGIQSSRVTEAKNVQLRDVTCPGLLCHLYVN